MTGDLARVGTLQAGPASDMSSTVPSLFLAFLLKDRFVDILLCIASAIPSVCTEDSDQGQGRQGPSRHHVGAVLGTGRRAFSLAGAPLPREPPRQVQSGTAKDGVWAQEGGGPGRPAYHGVVLRCLQQGQGELQGKGRCEAWSPIRGQKHGHGHPNVSRSLAPHSTHPSGVST